MHHCVLKEQHLHLPALTGMIRELFRLVEFFHTRTVTYPLEFSSPNESPELGHCPKPRGSLANIQMIRSFRFAVPLGYEHKGSKSGADVPPPRLVELAWAARVLEFFQSCCFFVVGICLT